MSLDLRFERVIDAPPAEVFEVFTQPSGQVAFYGKDQPGWIVESQCELRVGGIWTVAFGPSRGEAVRRGHLPQPRKRSAEDPRDLHVRDNTARHSGTTVTAQTSEAPATI